MLPALAYDVSMEMWTLPLIAERLQSSMVWRARSSAGKGLTKEHWRQGWQCITDKIHEAILGTSNSVRTLL